jgi:hypothetical protein
MAFMARLFLDQCVCATGTPTNIAFAVERLAAFCQAALFEATNRRNAVLARA